MNMSVLKNIVKYAIEGVVVAIAAHFIPRRKIPYLYIALVGLVASITFFVLNYIMSDCTSHITEKFYENDVQPDTKTDDSFKEEFDDDTMM